MTFEKWVIGILAVAFGASILWVFTRSRSADPVPAPPAGVPLPLREPPAPEPAVAGAPAPEATAIRHHAAPERRSATGGPSARRLLRSSRTITVHGHRTSRRHRHAKHATRASRPASPKAKPKA